jgi:hypothetical protein
VKNKKMLPEEIKCIVNKVKKKEKNFTFCI